MVQTLRKGTRWSRQVHLYLEDLAFRVIRRPNYEAGDDMTARRESITLSVEAKNTKRLELASFVDQAVKNAAADEIPVVVVKRRGRPHPVDAYVVLTGHDFGRLLRRIAVSGWVINQATAGLRHPRGSRGCGYRAVRHRSSSSSSRYPAADAGGARARAGGEVSVTRELLEVDGARWMLEIQRELLRSLEREGATEEQMDAVVIDTRTRGRARWSRRRCRRWTGGLGRAHEESAAAIMRAWGRAVP